MFTIHHIPGSTGIIIATNEDPANSIRVRNLPEFLALRHRIEEYTATLQPDGILSATSTLAAAEYISTVKARQLATTTGYNLPLNTLLSACAAGHIPGARKNRSRWEMPRHAFEEWLKEWAHHVKA